MILKVGIVLLIPNVFINIKLFYAGEIFPNVLDLFVEIVIKITAYWSYDLVTTVLENSCSREQLFANGSGYLDTAQEYSVFFSSGASYSLSPIKIPQKVR